MSPAVWERSRLKYVADCNRHVLSESTCDDRTFKYVDIGAVGQGTMDIPDDTTRFGDAPSRARRLAEPGDIVISTVRTYLRAVATVPETDEKLVFSTGFAVLHPRAGISRRFFAYVLQGDEFVDKVVANSVGVSYPAITATDLMSLDLQLPHVDEQHAIADYLDHETAQIDALVAKQEELIRHLEERRLTVITTAALMGLQGEEGGEHDFSRWGSSLAVEPWLARSPCSWRMERFKTVCLAREERNVTGTEMMLSLTVKGHLIDRSTMAIQQNASDVSIPRYFVARPSDLVVNPMWLIGGAIGVSDKRGAVSPDYRVFEIDTALNPRYLHAVLRSAPYFDQYKLYTRSNTTFDRRIKQNDLDNLPLPIPPIDEQRAIVEHIEEQTAQIDVLIAKSEEHIALAKERRSALITAAVTGQIDVRTARKAS
ncbi:restriction endonuclease subunit S [Dermabacter hominis]|uniref:restriction endonuclease subunit S n=1 Tax=Dermabacter hominis TaxID=36740 RepID=UPI0007744AB5|nr:restriction endonuclease subunit S [Dermabacter hominis]